MTVTIDQNWLKDQSLQQVLSLLNEGDGEARIAGGAVRNALLDQPVADVDIATTLVPRDVILRMQDAGHKSVPTGIEHGTVTVVVDGEAFEVTTLRRDIETDGRHAKVLYGTDWTRDARRRDLTINALYMNADGTVFDPINGLSDVRSQTVRFIDDAETRIKEDYLRILRFFRFFAWYGRFRPDAEGLKACSRLKDGLDSLSAERIWQELSKLFAAPDPGRAILWMRQTGVLSAVLPESEKWGIDSIPSLIRAEQKFDWEADPLLRMMAVLPPNLSTLKSFAKRLKLPNKVRDRFLQFAKTPVPDAKLKKQEFCQWLYWEDQQAVVDMLRINVLKDEGYAKKRLRQLKWTHQFEKPKFPIRGQDLLNQGMKPGPQIAEKMEKLEKCWVDSGFQLAVDELLAD